MGKASRLKSEPKPIKLDFGCGPNPREGFEGVDQYSFDGKVTHIINIAKRILVPAEIDPITKRDLKGTVGDFVEWPWKDSSVEEAHASHFIEHLDANERCHFVNELYRILIPGGTCQIIIPHWASCRAYGDLTHKWPPVSEFWFYYLSREWRKGNAPHTDKEHWDKGFDCDFEATWGYTLRQDLAVKNQEYQQFAIANYKEVCQDTIANLKAKK